MHADDVVFVHVGAHLGCHVLLGPQLDDLILRLGVLHPLADGRGVLAQNVRQPGGQAVLRPGHGGRLAVHRLVDLQRREDNGLRAGGDGQYIAAGVVDRPAGGGDHRPPRLLAHGLALQLLVPGDLQVVQPEEQQHEHQNAHNERFCLLRANSTQINNDILIEQSLIAKLVLREDLLTNSIGQGLYSCDQ